MMTEENSEEDKTGRIVWHDLDVGEPNLPRARHR